MSGIIGWLRLDGASAADDTFRRLVQGSSYHGPDRSGTWSSGVIALAQHQLCTTPEAEHERQPTASNDGSLCAALDGRLDNREELLRALAAEPSHPVTDVELLLRTYTRWGLDCVTRLLGDFAFAIWDARERLLFCARDPLGVRPLYYTCNTRAFAVASGLRELVAAGCVPRDIDEAMVGEYLTGSLSSTSDTLYRHAYRLPAGHRLTVDARGLRLTRYWKPEEVTELRIGRVEAAERFRSLLFEAVRCRTRSQRPIAAQLSGGLDSSTVVSILGALQASAKLAQPFAAFSLTFPGLVCDETEYAGVVAARYRVPWHRLVAMSLPAAEFGPLAARYLDFPGYPNGICAAPLFHCVRAQNSRVVLTGMGGDDWLNAASPVARTLDLVPRGRLVTLARELRGSRGTTVATGTVRHLVARALDRCQVHGPRTALFERRLPPWLAPDFVRRTRLAERTAQLPPVPRGWSWSRALRLSGTEAAVRVHPLETEARTNSDDQIETRHPFYDVRIVEFLLALPEPVCATQNTNKLVLRDAMRGVLPESIRHRRSKATFEQTFHDALGSGAVRDAFMRMGHATSPDWIDGPRARAALGEYLGDRSVRHLWSLWAAYGIDLWWRALHEKPSEIATRTCAETPGSHKRASEEHGVLG